MIKPSLQIAFLLSIGFTFYSCQKREALGERILSKSLKAHGGLDLWERIDTLSFHKKTILYRKGGSKEREIRQYQSFYFGDILNGKIITLDTDTTVFYHQNGAYHKRIGDSLVILNNHEKMSVKKAFDAAFYVVSQPFHLRQSNAKISYQKDTMLEKNKTHVIKVTYEGDDENADQWMYFFDANTHRLVASKVHHSPTTSYIQNTQFDVQTDFIFNAERESFFLKKDGSKEYLRAAYFYSDFNIVLKNNQK